LLLCLVEAPLLQYLPWRASPFADVAGFPNLFLLLLALVIKTAQNFIVLVCQFIVISNTSSSSSLTYVARTFLYINVDITLTIAVLGLLEGYLKRSLLAGTQLSIEFNGIGGKNQGVHKGSSSLSFDDKSNGIELRESINPLNENRRDTIPTQVLENDGGDKTGEERAVAVGVAAEQRQQQQQQQQQQQHTSLQQQQRINEIERKMLGLSQEMDVKTREIEQKFNKRIEALEEAAMPLLSSLQDQDRQQHQQAE